MQSITSLAVSFCEFQKLKGNCRRVAVANAAEVRSALFSKKHYPQSKEETKDRGLRKAESNHLFHLCKRCENKEEQKMKKGLLFTTHAMICIFMLFLICTPVQADVSLSGDLEIDTSYTANSTDPDTDETVYDSSGRIKVIPAARTESGNLYFEAIAQILAKTDGTAGTDDVYGKVGTSVFDVQIGRWEAWNLYDESNDMLIVDAPTGAARYKANYARGRIDSAGQIALHVLPSDAFGLEVGFVYGQDDENLGYGADTDVNLVGVRPVILTKFGPAEFSAGLEMVTITPQDDSLEADISKLGFGARIKATFGIATLGINYASGTEGGTDTAGNDLDDQTTNSIGGFCDLALGTGVLTIGGSLTTKEDDGDDYTQEHNQYYVAYALPLPIDGATIKFAVSSASASNDDPAIEDSDASAFKVRLNYNF